MKLSTRTRYGMRLMLELAKNYDKGAVQLNVISESQNISEKYLSHIVIQLRLAGLINSIRGAQGGYYLTRKPEEINTKDIVEALEGTLNIVDCVGNKADCERSEKCITINLWELLSAKIGETLAQIKLSDLLEWCRQKDELTYNI